MLSINDVYRITAYQTYALQAVQNVFFYQLLNIPEGVGFLDQEDTILEAFKSEVGDVMRTAQHVGCEHVLYRFDNLTNGIDFREMAVNEFGAQPNPAGPSFMAINFKLIRQTGVTRNGSKRLGGLSEDAYGANGINLSGTLITNLEGAFGTALHNPIGGENIGAPLIVGRTLEIDEEGKETYVLDLAKLNPIVGCQVTASTTQRSRKPGKGI